MEYTCTKCGATGVKLWREYQTCQTQLFCAPCALVDQKKEGPVDSTGKIPSYFVLGQERHYHGLTDQIGWLVPSVPVPQGDGFWGYTSVPDEGCRWWRELPTDPPVSV